MKVRVSPPYPGAGSFEAKVIREARNGGYELGGGSVIPASWCEKIPEVVPQEGDIVEDFDGDIFVVEAVADGIYYRENGVSIVPSRVLARKPKGFEEARKAINAFGSEWCDSDTEAGERDAYETFLRAILGGAEYGRVEG